MLRSPHSGWVDIKGDRRRSRRQLNEIRRALEVDMVTELRMPFERFFSLCEKHRWKLETDVEWDAIRRELVSREELETVRRDRRRSARPVLR